MKTTILRIPAQHLMISMNDQTDVKGRSDSIDHVPALLFHLRLEWLLQHFPTRVVWAIYVCIKRLHYHRAALVAGSRYR